MLRSLFTTVALGSRHLAGDVLGSYEWDTNDAFTTPTQQNASNVTYLGTMARWHVGNSFTGYFAYLATHNSGTYSIDYMGNNGYSVTLAVTDTGTAGYQLFATNIRQGVTLNPDGSYVAGSGSAVGSFSFFAQNAVIPPGNANSGTTNDVHPGAVE